MKEVRLDQSQRLAVEIEPGTRQIVIAGPGTGKTEVVSNLIAHLVEDAEVDGTNGVLVISFSNAAVHAADARVRANGVGPVTVQTTDSLAGELVNDLSDDDASGLGFDRRVELATKLLNDDGWDRLTELEHLIVDEVQDIVGVRADFLVALLEHLPHEAGFSLLGDPAQGIYDFQIHAENEPISTTPSAALLAVATRLGNVEVKHLTGQYRAESLDARKVVELRDTVLKGNGASLLDDFFADLVPMGSIADVVDASGGWSGTTAFLTANNGQALLVARALAEAGASAEVRRSAQQRVHSAWIARLLADNPTAGVTRDELDRLVRARMPGLDAGALWRALRSVAGGRGREVDLCRLSAGLRRPRPLVPDLVDVPALPFVVSTVHRAKGLEFDNVVVVDFPEKHWLEDDGDPDEAVRERFVALSRARRLILRAQGPDDRNLRQLALRSMRASRWYVGGRSKWMTFGYELRVDDFDRSAPPGVDKFAAQEHISHRVRPGDPLEFRLDVEMSTLGVPVWSIEHDGVVIGHTSGDFGRDLVARIETLENKKRNWPGLSGARVESVVTVAGEPQDGDIGRHGLWLAPVSAGMLQIEWNGDGNG